MTGLQLLDQLSIEQAEQLWERIHSIMNATSALDIDAGVDRWMNVSGYGRMIGFPSMPGTSSTATTGVPTAGIAGFAKGALFLNFKGSVGSLLYVNTGTNTSATWTNVV